MKFRLCWGGRLRRPSRSNGRRRITRQHNGILMASRGPHREGNQVKSSDRSVTVINSNKPHQTGLPSASGGRRRSEGKRLWQNSKNYRSFSPPPTPPQEDPCLALLLPPHPSGRRPPPHRLLFVDHRPCRRLLVVGRARSGRGGSCGQDPFLAAAEVAAPTSRQNVLRGGRNLFCVAGSGVRHASKATVNRGLCVAGASARYG